MDLSTRIISIQINLDKSTKFYPLLSRENWRNWFTTSKCASTCFSPFFSWFIQFSPIHPPERIFWILSGEYANPGHMPGSWLMPQARVQVINAKPIFIVSNNNKTHSRSVTTHSPDSRSYEGEASDASSPNPEREGSDTTQIWGTLMSTNINKLWSEWNFTRQSSRRFDLVRTRLKEASSTVLLDSSHPKYLETIGVHSDVAQIWVVARRCPVHRPLMLVMWENCNKCRLVSWVWFVPVSFWPNIVMWHRADRELWLTLPRLFRASRDPGPLARPNHLPSSQSPVSGPVSHHISSLGCYKSGNTQPLSLYSLFGSD